MIFKYEAVTNIGDKKIGTVEASSKDLAIVAIQRRGLLVSYIEEEGVKKNILGLSFLGGEKISMKDIVMMSRQVSTLFESQVSALKAFTLLASNTENKALIRVLNIVSEDIKSGVSISEAMAKHKEVFSDFYVNMVKAGEESGKLNETFSYLADYLERQYQLTSKTKNALIYPAFVIGVFIIVLILMFLVIVPKLGVIIKESSIEIPFATKIIMAISDFFVNYGVFILVALVIFVFFVIRYVRTPSGKIYFDKVKISIPVIKNIYTKMYLSRISDNMETMLSSGIPILRTIELTGAVVRNRVFEEVLKKVAEDVKSGSSVSDAFYKHKEIPQIMSGMVKVGEETGSLENILKTLGRFYNREVNEAVDTLIGLIEPIMIVFLGLGVGVLLSAILMPIYDIAGSIN